MKQNHKKIKIYSEAFCSLVTNFQEFQTTKIMLNDFVVLMKKDSTISAFLQSKSIDRSQKVGIFKNALNDVINNDLLNIFVSGYNLDPCPPDRIIPLILFPP